MLRGNTLNSKAGYNGSGLTRLTLRLEDTAKEPTVKHQDLNKEEGLEIMRKKAMKMQRQQKP